MERQKTAHTRGSAKGRVDQVWTAQPSRALGTPSIASLIDSDDSIEPEEKLGYGMMDTAAPEGAFKMTNVHCKLLVLITRQQVWPNASG